MLRMNLIWVDQGINQKKEIGTFATICYAHECCFLSFYATEKMLDLFLDSLYTVKILQSKHFYVTLSRYHSSPWCSKIRKSFYCQIINRQGSWCSCQRQSRVHTIACKCLHTIMGFCTRNYIKNTSQSQVPHSKRPIMDVIFSINSKPEITL